jgi:hypothetical protein
MERERYESAVAFLLGGGGEASWDRRLGELREFRAAHGHCNVPQKFEGNRTLGRWVSRQRLLYRRNKLSAGGEIIKDRVNCLTPERITMLESMGFEWVRGRGRRSSSSIASATSVATGKQQRSMVNDGPATREQDDSRRKKALAVESQIQIGTRLAVYWPSDNQYHSATVVKKIQQKTDPPSMLVSLLYDHIPTQWIDLDLTEHDFALLPREK